MKLYLPAAGSFKDSHFQGHFLTEHIYKRLTFSVFLIQAKKGIFCGTKINLGWITPQHF